MFIQSIQLSKKILKREYDLNNPNNMMLRDSQYRHQHALKVMNILK